MSLLRINLHDKKPLDMTAAKGPTPNNPGQ